MNLRWHVDIDRLLNSRQLPALLCSVLLVLTGSVIAQVCQHVNADCKPMTGCTDCIVGAYPTNNCAHGGCWSTSCTNGGTGITTCVYLQGGECTQTSLGNTLACSQCTDYFNGCVTNGTCTARECEGTGQALENWDNWPYCT